MDSSHGSARLRQRPEGALSCVQQPSRPPRVAEHSRRPYQGCSRTKRRRGVIRTRPRVVGARRRRARRAATRTRWRDNELVYLELPEDVHLGVACWTGRSSRWVHLTVAIAFDLRYKEIRPQMCNGGVSRAALLAIAAARARHADFQTGRNCRPTNARLAELTGFSVRQVQRADEALRLLGVATEVLRGRQRTRAERLASWRVGDRGRGWASVWVLHDSAWLMVVINSMSSHPEGALLRSKRSFDYPLTTRKRSPKGSRGCGAGRRKSPDTGGSALARSWRATVDCPPWARRHSPQAWAALLAAPARHGWTARDLTQLVTDWLGVTGRTIPDNPYRPIGLLGAILAWHGPENLDDRPAAAEEAREAAEVAAAAARVASQRTQLTPPAGPDSGGAGRVAARAAAAEAVRNAARKRTAEAARQQAALQEAVRRARG